MTERKPEFTVDEVVTGMCLWEAWMDLLAFTDATLVHPPEPEVTRLAKIAERLQGEHGSFTIRGALVDLIKGCDAGWEAIKALEDNEGPQMDAFDWEWCPQFIRDALTNDLLEKAIQWQYDGRPTE